MSREVRRTSLHYEAWLDGERVGELAYARHGDIVTALHTEVSASAAGNGVGSALARAMLDEARATGRRVRVRCPFVADWVDRHPDYADLLVS